ncbi:MAG: ferritin-like domain-containing protein [bacterium]|nr:ferritin-like domain-containing protein [bacterium]MXZ78028.1 ferritin-like domain-containing protein [Acidimicrobiia bacterium]MYE72974.1 ferritin-like domain-containing protein [Acidimicrobiia bacterium]MYJ63423.1 ferritin-like domain-containing protein [Acidimicrobiia bacterium]
MAPPTRTDEEIIGRADVNDIDTIIDISRANSDVTSLIHTVQDNSDALFTWDYAKGARPQLERLYEKAKTSQWNAQTDLDWSIEVDPYEAFSVFSESNFTPEFEPDKSRRLPTDNWGEAEWREFSLESFKWRMSQFLHGEQGALLCTAKIVETVPWIDAKYYAATQVVDEARHVEVFGQYIETKLGDSYPINVHLKMLLDDIINDSRWDMTYLGMQIMVEGLALAAFGFMYQLTPEPLLKQLLRYVMADEARHVAFGVLSLQEFYSELTVPELRERQEFAFEAAVRMRDRFLSQEVWERMGVPVRPMVENFLSLPAEQKPFQNILFSKIVPNCKKLGLLDAGDGWLRRRFEEIHVIEFEDWVDTGEEYEDFQLDEAAAV